MPCFKFANFFIPLALCAWFAGSELALAKSSVVNATELNLRAAPGTGAALLCKLSGGSEVEEIAAEKDGWIEVRGKGKGCSAQGFVKAQYLAKAFIPIPTAKPTGALPPSPAPPGPEEKLAAVPLVATSYRPEKNILRGLSEITSGLGLLTFGNLYRATALDLEKMLKDKLSLPELKPYFPDRGERDALAKQIANKINNKYLKTGLTNDNLIEATRYAAEELLEIVVKRAMAKQGVENASRRTLWAEKILQPFRQCMQSAVTYMEGNRCLAIAQVDAVKNIGLAVSYEVTRQEMGPAYTKGLAKAYTNCLNLKKPKSEERVKPCALQGVRDAAAKLGTDKVRDAAAKDAPLEANRIAGELKPGFVACLKKASGREGFAFCADQLIGRAGGEIAAASVMNNDHVKTYFPEKTDRRELGAGAKEKFKSCVDKNRQENRRDESGNVATANCVDFVRLEIAREVTHALIRQNLAPMDDLAKEQKEKIQKSVGESLNSCWDSSAGDDKNNACMKSTIELLVGTVAKLKLGQKIPPALAALDPTLKEKLSAQVANCIRRDLPDNVMGSSNAAQIVEDCAGKLMREAALKIAAFELRQVLHGKLKNPNDANTLTKKLVDQDLGTCLGSIPTQAVLGQCGLNLKKSAATSLGELLLPQEFDRFIEKHGGLAAFRLQSSDRDKFLQSLQTKHGKCLAKMEDEKKADAEVDTCFKASIQTLAGHLAELAFRKSSREHISDPAQLDELTQSFQLDLHACLGEKSAPEFSLNDFIAQIDICGTRLTLAYTKKIGLEQLQKALAENITEENLRDGIQKSLSDKFSACLENSSDQDPCVNELKNQAVVSIAREASRAQTKTLLNGGPLPAAIPKAELELAACVAKKESATFCARQHASNVAKILGGIKLKIALGEALGEDKYIESGRSIASLEQNYIFCIDNIPGTELNPEFMRALRECGAHLEGAGIGMVQSALEEWLAVPSAGAEEAQLRRNVANTLPCFSTLLPSGPITEDALQELKPEGLLQEIAGLVGEYIDQDAAKADEDFDELLAQLSRDMKAAGPAEARRGLLDLLIKRGMVDGLLKAMVRAEVRKSLADLPEEDRLPEDLQKILLDHSTIAAALTPERMEKFRPFLADKILKPLLIEGRSLQEPAINAAVDQMKAEVGAALLDSRAFGEKLVVGAVQKQIDYQTSNLTGWFGSFAYSYNWSQLRTKPAGIKAEAYLKENIIRPLVLGQKLSPEENAHRRAEAARLVEAAIKGQ